MGQRQGPVENMGLMAHPDFWKRRRVLVTGHTGFKGGWLTLWLAMMGARVAGIALAPPSSASLFDVAGIGRICDSHLVDIRDAHALRTAVDQIAPEVVFHCAAQPLVRLSYADPLGTWMTNVMGTIHLMQALREHTDLGALVVVTSDKCYENREAGLAFREGDALGGRDPYSSSKGATEIAVASWRHSFFREHKACVATVRAGNVIGGGDWAEDRLVPDLLAGFANGKSVPIRHPDAIRPWQHVLEPVAGYLLLAERLMLGGRDFEGPWNFGPDEIDVSVGALAERMRQRFGGNARWHHEGGEHLHEARLLALDSRKAREQLSWRPRMSVDQAIDETIAWHQAWLAGRDMQNFTSLQIERYSSQA